MHDRRLAAVLCVAPIVAVAAPARAQEIVPPEEPRAAAPPSPRARDTSSPRANDEPTYGAVAVTRAPPLGARQITAREARAVAGAMGEPLRTLDTLPGVLPLVSGLPYVYIRGAPPSGVGYFYDGISLPILFHAVVGPSIIHSALLSDMELYSAVAPAHLGRFVGGAVVAGAVSDAPPHRVASSRFARSIRPRCSMRRSAATCG